jgi:uncharacterized Zn finger protein
MGPECVRFEAADRDARCTHCARHWHEHPRISKSRTVEILIQLRDRSVFATTEKEQADALQEALDALDCRNITNERRS